MEEMISIPRSEYEQLKEQIASLSAVVKRQKEDLSLLKSGRSSWLLQELRSEFA
jgi:hypothetical protein